MKKAIFILILFYVNVLSGQKKDSLFILFNPIPGKVFISKDHKTQFDTYNYRFEVNPNYQKVLKFDPYFVKQEVINKYSKKDYRIKIHQWYISPEKLKNLHTKDYKWLKNKLSSLKRWERLSYFYNKIFIVEIDSIYRKAKIIEVGDLYHEERDLYLIFHKMHGKMYIVDDGIYTYNISLNSGFEEELYFEPCVDYQRNLRYRIKDVDKLKEYDLKDYNWLEKEVNKYKKYESIYQYYDKIYIVEMNPDQQTAKITKVNNIETIY